MAMNAVPDRPATPKTKTRAKQRYLRRKRDRRKVRKKTNDSEVPHQEEDPELSNTAADTGNISDHSASNDTHHSPLRTSDYRSRHEEKRQQPLAKRNERSKKYDGDEDVDMIDASQIQQPYSGPADRDPEESLVPTLPSFPLPALPDAPPKSVLALQGLDQALLDAEFVDPTTTSPVSEEVDDTVTGLSLKTRHRLKELGIDEFFAVQTRLLPFLLPLDISQRSLYLPYNPPRDVCVSAPTGSGKTLAYVLPIIEILSPRIVTRLRALIVLPTRDLVTQVKETFDTVGKGRGLKVGKPTHPFCIATGQHSFAQEQAKLVADRSPHLQGGSSKVDILVCTPGRLIDHLNATPNFSLQHLRFLVIDEADRLLAQSFQDWLVQATRPPSKIPDVMTSLPHMSYSDACAPAFMPYPLSPYVEKRESSCQKLLFSATLTRDPGKIAALDLRDPKYFIVGASKTSEQGDGVGMELALERFAIPSSLREHMIVCESSQKPLMLFYLIHSRDVCNALVFTKSAESTTRLVQLFEFFEQARLRNDTKVGVQPLSIRAYSSDLSAGERKSILNSFKAQDIQLLICSDLVSRGIDISHVSHVVSYDAPVDMRKYVHRVGRTARAGRAGDAWVLVEEQEARHFKTMLNAVDHLHNVKRVKVSQKDLAPLQKHYQTALDLLKEAYSR